MQRGRRTLALGLILVGLGLYTSAFPGLFKGFYLSASTAHLATNSESGAESQLLLSSVEGLLEANYSLFFGLVLCLVGAIVIGASFFVFSPVGVSVALIGLSLYSMPLFIDTTFRSFYMAIPQFVGLGLVVFSPFASRLIHSKRRRSVESARVGVTTLFSYAMTHNNLVRELERKISKLEEEKKLLEALRDDEGVDSIVNKLQWMGRKKRLLDWSSAGIIGMAIGFFFHWLGT